MRGGYILACFDPQRSGRGARARAPRRASQCSAASIKQAAIHGATVSRLRVIAGPVPASSTRTETKKRGDGRGAEQREREREDSEEGFSRGRARNRREKRERERRSRWKKELDQGGIEDRRGGKEGGGGGERNPESWCSGVLSTGTRALRGRVRETGPLEISPDSNRARENHVSPPATRFSLDTNVKREEEEEEGGKL